MATNQRTIKAVDVARMHGEATMRQFAVAIAQLTAAVQAIATKLDGDSGVNLTNYRSGIDAQMNFYVVE